MRTSLHRRIVAACRLDTLGSVGALRLGGFAAQKQLLTVLCLLRLRYAQSVEHAPIVAMSSARAAEKQKKNTTLRWCSFFGSPNWARTSDIMINSHALYRLSYRGILTAIAASENYYNTYFPACQLLFEKYFSFFYIGPIWY